VIWTTAYVASVVFVNWAFAALPMIPLPWGPLSPGTFLVGAIFILRDFSQREIGHRVLVATLIGIAVSFLMADPFVALASTAAFAASELADWAVYTLTKLPFRDRVFLSSCVSVPIDTVVFLAGIGGLTWIGFVVMCLSKMVAVAVVLWPRAQTEAA
jgi:queuosine precursor transporter